ncbi:MAG: 3-hydroxyacyl-CoA dehydrogenase family protein, partial [Thermoanaerobaculia bacterium]
GEVMQAAFPERMKGGGQDALAAAGRLGRKNGKGFYDYDGSTRLAPSAQAYALLRVARPAASPVSRSVIEARCVLPMINEAAFCLEDRIVRDAAKLDLAMIFGTGFPPFRGGLLRYADSLGAGHVLQRLDDLSDRLSPRFSASDLIQRLVRSGKTFYSLASETASAEIAS